MSTILIKKEWTRQEILDAHEVGGRKRGRTAGSWVDEIASQKKVITLCPECTPKFNPAKVGYRKEKEFPVCSAKCDGCSTLDNRCSMYIYAELYSTVRSTAEERRALAKRRAQRVRLTGHL
jgi:hypothetical protein